MEETEIKGKFFENLTRSNSKIKKDRAISITEELELTYKRKVEDLEMEIKTLKRKRESMLDLSPTDKDSLEVVKNLDVKAFAEEDIELGYKIEILQKRLKIAQNRYKELFQ